MKEKSIGIGSKGIAFALAFVSFSHSTFRFHGSNEVEKSKEYGTAKFSGLYA
jgi:hypothetical protein